jgi:hypothetical protein
LNRERKVQIAGRQEGPADIDRHCRSHNISAGYRVWSKSGVAWKVGVSGKQEESRGESKLSMVIEHGLGNDGDVVWEGSIVSLIVSLGVETSS